MASGPVHVVAHIPAHPDSIDELKQVLGSLVEPTRREAGCLRYDLWQNKETPTDFTFVEEWESDEALDAHLQSPHVVGALSSSAHLLGGEMDIRRYYVVR